MLKFISISSIKSKMAKNEIFLRKIKTDAEIALMKKSGRICAETLRGVLNNVKVGVSEMELDGTAQKLIEAKGASPSFWTVDDYKWTICTTINDQVVHGIPTKRTLAEGDILGIDIGAVYGGFHSDMAITVPVARVSKEAMRFLRVGEETLEKAIAMVRVGNRIGDISSVIQENIEGATYSVVKSLSGHGIGRNLHEEPMVPMFGQRNTGPKILQNMVLAIEVIYAYGSSEVELAQDGWTITTEDGQLAGLFEKTVAVTKDGPIVLTPYL